MRFILPALLFASVAAAQKPEKAPPPSPGERKADHDYQAALDAAQADFDKATSAAHKKLHDALKEELEMATKAGDLDRALALRDRMKKLDDDGPDTFKEGTRPKSGGKPRLVAGTWKLDYHPNGAPRSYKISANGDLEWEGKHFTLRPSSQSWILDSRDNKIERITFIGDAIFVEHFNPAKSFPLPVLVGYAPRVSK
jgi:hypothetical protein